MLFFCTIIFLLQLYIFFFRRLGQKHKTCNVRYTTGMGMDIFRYNNNKTIKNITVDFKQRCSKTVNA